MPHYADQSAKIGDNREVGGNRGRGRHDYSDVNGCSRRHGQLGGDNSNIQSRAETAQDFITYAGCHTNAGESYLGALIEGLDGALRTPTEDENICYARLDTGIREGGLPDSETYRQSEISWMVYSNERRRG
jgi:hypothetical protein